MQQPPLRLQVIVLMCLCTGGVLPCASSLFAVAFACCAFVFSERQRRDGVLSNILAANCVLAVACTLCHSAVAFTVAARSHAPSPFCSCWMPFTCSAFVAWYAAPPGLGTVNLLLPFLTLGAAYAHALHEFSRAVDHRRSVLILYVLVPSLVVFALSFAVCAVLSSLLLLFIVSRGTGPYLHTLCVVAAAFACIEALCVLWSADPLSMLPAFVLACHHTMACVWLPEFV